MLKKFQEFALRGNVVDLAIGVAIGAAFTTVVGAFTTVVGAFTTGMITPLLAIPGDSANFADNYFTISGSRFLYGTVINALIQFVIVAAALFFFVVVPVNKLMARRKTEPEVESTTKDCPRCLSSIPVAASRCAFCTSDV